MEESLKNEILNDIKNINSFNVPTILNKRKERLKTLVKYAKENSEYFKNLYKDIDVENFELSDLPIIEKPTMMEHYNQWVCDKNITKNEVEHYVADIELMLKPFKEKYKAITTSGTTGTPLLMVRDEMHEFIHGALLANRLFKDINASIMNPQINKIAAIIAAEQSTSSYASFLKMKKVNEKYADNMLLLSTLSPISEMVEKLNAFQPVFIGGYPSVLALLANEQIKGNLKMHPQAITCSAELLTEKVIETMKEAWGKELIILNNYCTTEGGEIAMSCSENKLHVNFDWVILEPVDENDNPVKDGETSNSVLVTDLSNFVQPIIRYRLNDRIKIINEKCKCGSILPTIEVKGRVSDTIKINSIEIPSIVLFLALEHLPRILSYQYAKVSKTKVVLRVVYAPDTDKKEFNKQITAKINDIKRKYNCEEMEFEISEERPKNNKKGGKLKLITNEYDK